MRFKRPDRQRAVRAVAPRAATLAKQEGSGGARWNFARQNWEGPKNGKRAEGRRTERSHRRDKRSRHSSWGDRHPGWFARSANVKRANRTNGRARHGRSGRREPPTPAKDGDEARRPPTASRRQAAPPRTRRQLPARARRSAPGAASSIASAALTTPSRSDPEASLRQLIHSRSAKEKREFAMRKPRTAPLGARAGLRARAGWGNRPRPRHE